MIDPESTWISTFASLPPTLDSSWIPNFATWCFNRVQNNELSGLLTASPPLLFEKSVFESELASLTPTLSAVTGITNFATAWENTIVASQVLLVVPGDSVGSPSPATTWSVVSSALVNSGSISAGKAKIMELVSDKGALDVLNAKMPVKLREAFLELKGDVSGLNSVTPTPQPLVASSVPLI